MTIIEAENEELKKEVLRLRMIIAREGVKWLTHHEDKEKKKYWQDFMSQVIQ